MQKIKLLIVFLFIILITIMNKKNDLYMGATICKYIKKDFTVISIDDSNRYQRPFKTTPIENKYNFYQAVNNKIPVVFNDPKDLLLVYYGILSESSNMLEYTGGCGLIGEGKQPYSYAYNLLSKQTRKKISLKQFENSFKGVGHINLLQINFLYGLQNFKYYMVEIETIEGGKKNNSQFNKTIFAYYYGIVTLKYNNGWLIESIYYIPENFLCAPYHNWFYDAKAVINIVYNENLKLVDKITSYEIYNNIITIEAIGKNKYRFEFIRLTNGYDFLVHEYVFDNGWKEVSLLTDEWKYLKISLANFQNEND